MFHDIFRDSHNGIWVNLASDDFEQSFAVRLTLLEGELPQPKTYQLNLVKGEEKQPFFSHSDAVGSMPRAAVQHLMDQLWGMGFRPKGEGTAGQYSAMTEHLKDLKEIATKLVDFVVKKS